MSNTPTLETERLILRKFTENDLEALYQIYRDPDVNRFLPWFPLQSMDEARKFFEDRYASLYAEPQACCCRQIPAIYGFCYPGRRR